MNCRGHRRRIYIINNYDITPVAHLKLLNGKTIPSDAGGDIEDTYFIFECKSKFSGKKEVICCGRPTAKELCEMAHQDMPKLFNPLVSTSLSTTKSTSNTEYNDNEKWHPARKQLYIATMLLITEWGGKPNTPLFNIKSDLEVYTTLKPRLRDIKGINTILANQHTTLRNILNELSKKNDIKKYSFDLLVEELNKHNIKQYFEN